MLLGRMGGPFWASKQRAWSIPKGGREAGDADLLAVAEREFAEEMGATAPDGVTVSLGSVRLGTKTVVVFARAASFDSSKITSNSFALEWPPHSGRMQLFPEMERAEWFDLPAARSCIVASQEPFLDRLVAALLAGRASES